MSPSANKKNAILDRWTRVLETGGERVAICGTDGAALRTFAGIEKESAAFQAAFEAYPAGTAVGIQIGNDPAWPAVLLALFRCGHIPLPLGGHMEPADLDAALAATGVGVLLQMKEGTPFADVTGVQPPRFGGTAPEFLKLTSGTTSAPRAILFRSSQLVADCDNICATMGFGPDDLNFGVIPFSHSYGFSNLLTPLLCRGVPLVASSDPMPRAIVDGLRRTRSTVFPGMPVFFQALCGLDGVRFPDLRLCISAGAPLRAALGQKFSARFGLKIHTFYGSSECGGITYDRSENLDYEDSYVGEPMDGVRIELQDPCAAVSRIEIRSAAVGDGYFPEADAETLGAGRFVPGDLIRKRGSGFSMAGRVSDIINVAGRKLNPLEVEARMGRLPGVREVVVFGVSSSMRNEEAVACVVPEGRVSAAELLGRCREVLSAWQVPKDVWFVEEIPTSERGKVVRREIARRYLSRESGAHAG